MQKLRERAPLLLTVAKRLLRHTDPLVTPFGTFSASEKSLQVLVQTEGTHIDKPESGAMQQPNLFAGGPRSAFCPIDDPTWRLRKPLQATAGDTKITTQMEKIQETVLEHSAELEFPELQDETVVIATFAREHMLRLLEKIIFDFSLSSAEAEKISEAYSVFNSWCALATLTRGFCDIGRQEKLNYLQIIQGEPVEKQKQNLLGLLSRAIYRRKQEEFNDSLVFIANHAKEVWEHLKKENHPLYVSYKQKAEELKIDEAHIILELTNVIGGIIGSPASFLGFCLSAYARLDTEEQEKIASDSSYRMHFFHEIQRLYQPLNWFIRDTIQPITINDTKVPEGHFLFLTYAYNRTKEIWGDDADTYNPDRFSKNPQLAKKLVFFGKGRRRCPAGRMGSVVAGLLFEQIIQTTTVSAQGPVTFKLKDTISPTGSVNFTPR